MKSMPQISIVTPSFNSAEFIEETICSVLDQKYPNCDYIIVDGGSTDGTIDIIRKYEKYLTTWISEPDRGMYDAINKGFAKATGDVYGWINSDDKYLQGAFQAVGESFKRHQEVDWICGRSSWIDMKGNVVKKRGVWLYHREELAKGYHGPCSFFVPQDACFWRSSLWRSVDKIPPDLKFAGDYWLWMNFAKHASLISLNHEVSLFRAYSGAGQLCKQMCNGENAYASEMFQCFPYSRSKAELMRKARKVFRSSLLDIRIYNLLKRRPAYQWIDPTNDYAIQETHKPRLA